LKIEILGIGVRVQGSGFRVKASEFKVVWFRVEDWGSRVES